jgi:hypothetical protein
VKKTFSYIFALLVLTQFTDCVILDKNVLCRIWFYDGNTPADFDSSLLSPVSFISFYADGTYTKDFGTFEFGRWRTDASRIVLSSEKNTTRTYPMQYTWPNALKITADNGFVAGFEGQPSRFFLPNDNPFALTNNQWRIPAARQETDRELSRRLINHIHFWELYFTWALKSKIDYIDVRSTPTLIKIYANGFILRKYENLPDEWKAYFFDEADCQKAYDLLRDALSQHKIVIEHKEDKYKMFISMFQQLQLQLK